MVGDKTFDSIDEIHDFAKNLSPSVITLLTQNISINSTAYEGKDHNGNQVKKKKKIDYEWNYLIFFFFLCSHLLDQKLNQHF